MQLALLSILTTASLTTVFTAWCLIWNNATTSIYNKAFVPNVLARAGWGPGSGWCCRRLTMTFCDQGVLRRVRYAIEKCGGLQWQLRLLLFESMNQYSGINIAKWGHLLIILMFTEKPWVPVCSHSSFSNETTNWSMLLAQKSWNLWPGAGKSLCLSMSSGAIP